MNLLERVLLAFGAATGGRVYGPGSSTTTNCVIAVADVLIGVYGEAVRGEWNRLMVMDPSQPFSNVDAVAEMGIGIRRDSPRPGTVCVVQGWRELDDVGHVPRNGRTPNGHAFLWVEPPAPFTAGGWLLNANTRRPWVRACTWADAVAPYAAGVELAELVDHVLD